MKPKFSILIPVFIVCMASFISGYIYSDYVNLLAIKTLDQSSFGLCVTDKGEGA